MLSVLLVCPCCPAHGWTTNHCCESACCANTADAAAATEKASTIVTQSAVVSKSGRKADFTMLTLQAGLVPRIFSYLFERIQQVQNKQV